MTWDEDRPGYDPQYGRCDTCGAPCVADGCSVEARHLTAIDPTALPKPAPNETGDLPHAFPAAVASYSTCTYCGAEVFFDDTDDEGTGIWTHTETLDYFCEAI
jgi:hypothetical protein